MAVVGAGHNALVAAAYLAKAGFHVGVFERRAIVGGAVATQEIVPGYQFDLGGSAHILIRLTPIVEELELDRYGLDYLEVDPMFFSPRTEGESVFIHRDLDRTVDALERALPGEGLAYRRFVDEWRPFARMVKEAFLAVPSPLALARRFVFTRGMRADWKRALPRILRPYGTVLDEYFESEDLIAPLVWMAAQSGPPPGEPFSAPFALWQPLYHEGGIARPRGGSGGLTIALASCVEAYGGTVHLGTPVEGIRVENGRAVGVTVDGGRAVTARAVLSGAHVMETFGKLLPEEFVPDGARRVRVGNGFGMIVRLALNAPVRYRASPGVDARIALQLLCRDRAQIDAAYADYLRGMPAEDPPIVAMSFSAVDSSLAPPGGEVLWLWAQYFPYRLREGHWDELGERIADRIIDQFEAYAPGTRDSIVGRLVQHPLWLERELGLFQGNVMHLEMGLDQMFAMRPFLGASGYRTPLKALYLTGASTHPGGGIMGASGRNAARVLLKDLSRKRV